MNPRKMVLEPKRTTKIGEWSAGPVSRRSFPLFKRQFPINACWHWRVATIESASHEYRLLVQMRIDKPNQKAWLIVKLSDGWAMVARLESHSHSGLHCHAECGGGMTIGEIAPAGMLSLPHWKAYHRRPYRLRSLQEWWELALRFFRAQAGEKGTLV